MALTVTEIQQLYTAYLGRPVDQEGLDYWTDAELDLNVADLRFNLANDNQPEYVERYGNLSREELVAEIYQNMFNRAPEAEGLAYWTTGEGSVVPANELQQLFIEAASEADRTKFDELVAADEEAIGTDTSELTEELEAYEAAVQTRDEALEEFQTAVVDAASLNVDEDDFDIDEASTYIDQAEGAVEDATAALATARSEDFSAANAQFAADALDGDASTGYDAADGFVRADGEVDLTDANVGFYNDDLLDDGDRLSDSALAQLVEDAQAALSADTNRYDEDGSVLAQATADAADGVAGVEEGDWIPATFNADGEAEATLTDGSATADSAVDDVFTARQLQSRYNAAESTLRGDVTSNGTTQEIAVDVSAAIGSFLAENADVGGLTALQGAYRTAAENTANGQDDQFALGSAFADAVDDALADAFTDFDAADRDETTATDAVDDLDGEGSLVSLLLQLNTRLGNEEAVLDTQDALGETPSGSDFLLAEALQADREGLVEELNDAQTLVDTLETSFEAYETAVDAVAAASEELGYEVTEVDDGILFGTADTDDLFIFNAEELEDLGFANITLEELEAGDALFFGTDYQQGTDIEAGDNNALEFFVTANTAGDTVLEVENSAFGSANDDSFSVTLVGVAQEDLSIEGGVVSIA